MLHVHGMKDQLWNWGWRQVYVCEFGCRRGVGPGLVEFHFGWTHRIGTGRHLPMRYPEVGLDPLERGDGHPVQVIVVFVTDHVDGQRYHLHVSCVVFSDFAYSD